MKENKIEMLYRKSIFINDIKKYSSSSDIEFPSILVIQKILNEFLKISHFVNILSSSIYSKNYVCILMVIRRKKIGMKLNLYSNSEL